MILTQQPEYEVIVAEAQSSVEYRYGKGKYLGYRIGDDGSVWTEKKTRGVKGTRGLQSFLSGEWRRMQEWSNEYGHLGVTLCHKNKSTRIFVHRLVLEAFIGPCPPGKQCCHNDGNPTNNSLSNLRWDTAKANHADKQRHGTQIKGSQHRLAKLTEDDVREIRRLLDFGLATRMELADRYKVTYMTISGIHRRLKWTHVTE